MRPRMQSRAPRAEPKHPPGCKIDRRLSSHTASRGNRFVSTRMHCGSMVDNSENIVTNLPSYAQILLKKVTTWNKFHVVGSSPCSSNFCCRSCHATYTLHFRDFRLYRMDKTCRATVACRGLPHLSV